MLLLLAAALPSLYWDEPPATAAQLQEAGIASIQVPAARASEWKNIAGITVETADLQGAGKLLAPSVEYRPNQATASRAPWIDSNVWQFLRAPEGRYYYDVKGPQAALAAAEAHSFGVKALIRSDAAGLKPFARMLEFLRGLPAGEGAPVADIGFIDDGSADAGEVMNLMARNNLLFVVTPRPDPRMKLTVRLGSPEFPLKEAQENPAMTAHEARAKLTDEKRSLRIYGSAVVLGRITTLPNGLRVHLLNYDGARRKVDGLRVRVVGRYEKHRLAAADSPGVELLDYTTEPNATEFTLPELKTYAVIDLTR